MTITEKLWRGMRAAHAGRNAEAQAAFQAVLREDPVNETALVWLGYLADDSHASLDYITQALEAHPQSPRIHAALKWAWRRTAASTSQAASEERGATSPVQSSQRRWRWKVYQTGLAALWMVLMMFALVGWMVNPPAWAEPPAAAAMAVSSPSPPAPMTTDLDLPSATPTPTPISIPAGTPSSTSPAFTPIPIPTPTPPPPGAALVVPEPFPTIVPTVLAAISTTLPIPTPVPPVPVAADAINIVVLGSDQRPDWSEWHTDVVQVISIQRDRGAVSVISIPRDLYLYIPGFWMSRINFADFYGEAYGYEGGGPALVRDTLLYNLGIRVDYYARTNFDGLIGVVDTIGGVDIPVHCHLSDHWPYPDENGEYPILTLEPGIHHMDGETALWYARSRLTTNVFSRERRQQQVLQAIWHKARDAGMLSQIPALWSQGQDMVETDLTFTEILDLALIALTLEDQNVRFYNIGADVLDPWVTPHGGWVFLPRWEDVQPLLAEAMAPAPEARLGRVYLTVDVWNGTPNEGWGWLAADRLYRAGFPAVVNEADQQDYAETQLIVFTEHTKGTGVGYLQQMFQIPDSHVIHQPGGSSEFGFRLILGADYQTCP